jgi:hypothetical protein
MTHVKQQCECSNCVVVRRMNAAWLDARTQVSGASTLTRDKVMGVTMPEDKEAESPIVEAPEPDAFRGWMIGHHIDKAKTQLDQDYPEQSRVKSLVHTKLDEAKLWATRLAIVVPAMLLIACGGFLQAADAGLIKYGHMLAVYCPQADQTPKCINARRRYEVSTAAVQTATLVEAQGKDAAKLWGQAEAVLNATLAEFKALFLEQNP